MGMKVYVVEVQGKIERQHIQVSVLAWSQEEAAEKARTLVQKRYCWKPDFAQVVTYEGRAIMV